MILRWRDEGVDLSSKKRIAQAAFIVFLLNTVAKFGGFFRTLIVAMFFGASGSTDAEGIAAALTGSVTILSGPISTAFLPVLTSHLAKGDDEGARRVTSSVMTVSVLLVFGLSTVAAVFAPALVRFIGSGLSQDAFGSAVLLTRVYFPAMVLPLLAVYAKFMLNAHDEFNIPAMSVTVQNLTTIAVIALLAPVFGVFALAIGFVLSNGVALLVQLLAWRKRAAFPRFSLRLDDSSRSVFRLAMPLVLSSVFAQAYVLVDRNLASRLAEGSVAVLGYADRLRQVPLGLFVAAVTTVIYPSLSSMWAREDKAGFRETAIMGLRYVEFICIPAAVGLMVLARPIVRLAYERMAFTSDATLATAGVLTAYASALVAMAASQVITYAFYSAQETRLPVAIGIGTSLLNALLDFALVGALGLAGLGVANSVASTAGALAGLYLLSRLLGGLPVAGLAKSLAKILAASAAMGGVAFFLSNATGFATGTGSFFRDVVAAGVTVGAAGLTFAVLAYLLKCEEMTMFIGLAKDKFRSLAKKVRQ
ncbi:MAG: murein biosynthesis integral membrane protein MurJ [Bacillota bacterium]